MSSDKVIKMRQIQFEPSLFFNFKTDTLLDELLSTHKGLPKGVNYMVIGDPGVGKTTIVLDLLANIQKQYSEAKILFVSAEMNEIDLAIYVQRYPKFNDLNILFVESDYDLMMHNWDNLTEVVEQGWDIIAIDSFHELQGMVKEEENVKMREAEGMLLSLIKKQNKAQNRLGINTSFLTIQQVTKSGAFIGTNRLKHMITAMMELRLENPRNAFSDRYAVFSKHRRGDVGVKLYYNLNAIGDVRYNAERFEQDLRLKHIQQHVSSQIRDFADEFDKIFP